MLSLLAFKTLINLVFSPSSSSSSSPTFLCENLINMSGATAEVDFFGIQKQLPSKSQFQKLLEHGRSFRGIQTVTQTPDIKTAPLTIFYNGTVSIFHLPVDKAEMIMKLSEEANAEQIKSEQDVSRRAQHKQLLEKLNGDLPIARKRSLQRFLEKRKERITFSPCPYAGGGPESAMEKKVE